MPRTKKATIENAVEIKVDDTLSIKVNQFPTLGEKIAFVKAVVDDSYIDNDSTMGFEIHDTFIDAKFTVLFLTAFTDYTFPSKLKNENGTIEIENAYNHIRTINWNTFINDPSIRELISQLKDDVKQRIAFENAKIIALYSRSDELKETYEGLNSLITTGKNFFEKAIDKLNLISPAIQDLFSNPNAMENLITLFKGEENSGE